MLFMTPIASAQAAKDYFARQLAPSDYYVRDAQEMAGQWHGLTAQLLGLEGQTITQDAFFAFCENRNPVTGEKLTARTKAARRVGYDFTFDAPKAVSLAYEIGGDERVLAAFRASVADTMDEMESDMHARVRAGGADTDRRTANMVWAEFLHRTTRPVDGIPDPQLHCHAIAMNATFDAEEGRMKAGQFGTLVRDKLYYQAAFHARLAERLTALGYEVRRDRTSFTLAGLDRATLAKFSRRSAVIEAAAERHGITNAKAKGELGRRTREAKSAGESVAGLRSAWDARLTEEERKAIGSLCKAGGNSGGDDAGKAALDFAMAHCFERASVVPEKKLFAEALMQGVGKAGPADVLRHAAHADIIRRQYAGQVFATTRSICRDEVALQCFVRNRLGWHNKMGGNGPYLLDAGLSDEQRKAAELILGSRATVVGLRGGAGTGKTRMMQATVAAIEAAGHQVFTFAPSAKASRGVLREEGFASADTVERLLTDQQMQGRVHGQVLWIDEAGLLSTRDMRRLFDLAKEENCRVILSGDSAQHSAVAAGDAMRMLERDAGLKCAQLRDIRRQTDEQYREAVREIAQAGETAKGGRMLDAGIARLDRIGAIIEAVEQQRHKLLAADYVHATAERRPYGKAKTALVVSPTHREGDKVAAAIRAELKQAGRLTGRERAFLSLKSLGLTAAQRSAASSYRGGEVIRFHQNVNGFDRGERVTVASVSGDEVKVARADGRLAALPLKEAQRFEVYEAKRLLLAAGDRIRITMNGFSEEVKRGAIKSKGRLNNGDMFEVAGFTKRGDIRLTNGFVLSALYGGIAQGYVVTSHASQGSTVDKVLIALGSESLAAANRQQFYVSVSRGRQAVRLYTDDKAARRCPARC